MLAQACTHRCRPSDSSDLSLSLFVGKTPHRSPAQIDCSVRARSPSTHSPRAARFLCFTISTSARRAFVETATNRRSSRQRRRPQIRLRRRNVVSARVVPLQLCAARRQTTLLAQQATSHTRCSRLHTVALQQSHPLPFALRMSASCRGRVVIV